MRKSIQIYLWQNSFPTGPVTGAISAPMRPNERSSPTVYQDTAAGTCGHGGLSAYVLPQVYAFTREEEKVAYISIS